MNASFLYNSILEIINCGPRNYTPKIFFFIHFHCNVGKGALKITCAVFKIWKFLFKRTDNKTTNDQDEEVEFDEDLESLVKN